MWTVEEIKNNKFNIFAGFASIISIVLYFLEQANKNYAVCGMAIFICLYIAWWTVFLFKLSQSKKLMKNKNEELIQTIDSLTNNHQKDISCAKKRFDILNDFQLALSKIVNHYCSKARRHRILFDKELFELDLKYEGESDDNVNYCQDKDSMMKNHYDRLQEQQQRLLKEIVELVKTSLESMIRNKGFLEQKISISIKMLDHSVKQNFQKGLDGISLASVKTIFRDSDTYNLGEREINKKTYTIKGNMDFMHCAQANGLSIKEALFLENNLLKISRYTNENANFANFYDAVIVAPIANYFSDKGSKLIFGFFTCDTKLIGSPYEGKEIFDADIEGKMLMSAANGLSLVLSEYNLDVIDLNIGITQK